MIDVYLEWDFALDLEPLPDFCDDFHGVMQWIIRGPDNEWLGDLAASRCNDRLNWTARHIVAHSILSAEVVAVGQNQTRADWNLYVGAAEALAEIDMVLKRPVPVGRIKRYHPSKGDKSGSVYDDD